MREQLTARRKSSGFTLESLAELLGVARHTVWRWENNLSTPQPQHRPGLCTALNLTPEQLDTLLTPHPAAQEAEPTAAEPPPTPPADLNTPTAVEIAAMPDDGHLPKIAANGRQPSTPAPVAALGHAIDARGGLDRIYEARSARPELEQLRQGLDHELTAESASAVTLEDWEQLALRHGRATRDQAAPILLRDLADDLAELRTAMSRYRAASSTRRLARVSAQLSGLMCLTLCKLDDRPAFRRWARTARVAAREAGDPLTTSWILAQEAYGHYYAGHLGEAIRIAESAQRAGARRGVGAALAAALEARAYAALGPQHGQDVRAALGRAEEFLGALDGEATVPSAFGYTEAQLRFHSGSAFTHLGATRDALSAQERALALAPPTDYTDRALTRLDRAVCLAHDGDVTGAMAEAIDTLTRLTVSQRNGIIDQRGQALLAALPQGQRATLAARDLRDLLETEEGK